MPRSNPLQDLIKEILSKKGITKDKLLELHADYFERNKLPPNLRKGTCYRFINSLSDNVRSIMSVKLFCHFILNVLNLNIVKISVTVVDPKTNVQETFSTDVR